MIRAGSTCSSRSPRGLVRQRHAIAGAPLERDHRRTGDGGAATTRSRGTFRQGLRDWDPAGILGAVAASGARYLVVSAKHHDGFALWPARTKNPRKRGWQASRDVVGELAEGARACGLRFGLYYSAGLDWTFGGTPHQKPRRTWLAAIPRTRSYAAYVDAHWRELISRYSPSILWNDVGSPAGAGPAGSLLRLLRGGAGWRGQRPLRPARSRRSRAGLGSRIARAVTPACSAPLGAAVTGARAGRRSPSGTRTSTPSIPRRRPRPGRALGMRARPRLLRGPFHRGNRGPPAAGVGPRAPALRRDRPRRQPPARRRPESGRNARAPCRPASLHGLGDWLKLNGEAIFGTRPWGEREGCDGGRDRGALHHAGE